MSGFLRVDPHGPMCSVSSRPICVQVRPASIDFVDAPCPCSPRSRHADVSGADEMMSGFEGATPDAPMEATFIWSKMGDHTTPPSMVFQTPPPGDPM